MFKDVTLHDFIKDLGSNSPAPGGGSAAALIASLSAALTSMVFNLTLNKKSYNALKEEERKLVDDGLEKCKKSMIDFLDYMEKDTEVFMELMSFFKLPKETEEEKEYRSEKIKEGTKNALLVPFEISKKAFDSYDIIDVAAKYGNKNAISDAGVAALSLQTSIEAALLNVKINLASIKDESYKKEILKECNKLQEQGRIKRDRIMEIVNNEINS